MHQNSESRLQSMLDREELFDLVRRERFSRDQHRFDAMSECFHPDAYIRTSWYDGRGGQAYVDASRTAMERATNNKGSSKHWVFPAVADVKGDRATVESPAMIFNRVALEGVEVDFHVFCRFFSRAVREEGAWRLLSFEVLFERDVLKPVNPEETAPIDWVHLSTLRPSYKFLAYLQSKRGVDVNQQLLGDDQRDQLNAFYSAERRWLDGEG